MIWSLWLPFLLQVTDKNPLDQAAYFVPTDTLRQPFVAWEVKSSDPSHGKYLVVNADGSLSVKAFDFTECRQTATFVKIMSGMKNKEWNSVGNIFSWLNEREKSSLKLICISKIYDHSNRRIRLRCSIFVATQIISFGN